MLRDCLTKELAWLSRCCCAVEMLHLRLFGPEGTKNMEWLDAWSHSLKRLLDEFKDSVTQLVDCFRSLYLDP